MKKIKQIAGSAGKAFVRNDQKEILSDALLDNERRIELIRQTCETISKKISACLPLQQSQGQGKDGKSDTGTGPDRRIKRVPEFILGFSLQEFGTKLGSTSCLGEVLEETGKSEMRVGNLTVEFEEHVEKLILTPIKTILQEDIPNIIRLKKTLIKLTENLDLAKGKLMQATHRQSGSSSTLNGEKMTICKDDVEDCVQKVEQCRENLATEMHHVIRREPEIAQYVIMFLNFQTEYHQKISLALGQLPSQIQTLLANGIHKPVYGIDLVEHLNGSGRTIAYPIELCVCALLEIGMDEEGLFRLAGSSSKIKKLKVAFDSELFDLSSLLNEETSDAHVISNALKCYLRELPNPLLTLDLFPEWMAAIRVTDSQAKLTALWKVVQMLPEANKNNLRYLIKFFKVLTASQSVNKMSPSNLAIVIGPNLLWAPPSSSVGNSDETSSDLGLTVTHLFSSIVDQLITYADWFFPGDEEFILTCKNTKMGDSFDEGVVTVTKPGEIQIPESNFEIEKSRGHSRESSLVTNLANLSKSVSSLDDTSPPSSPKFVIRRPKNKPAPTPPKVNPSAGAGAKESEAKEKREGGFYTIPPSPNQTRKATAGERPRLGPPPKPPQPGVLKHSFNRSLDNDIMDTRKEKDEKKSASSTHVQRSDSLPKRFETGNSIEIDEELFASASSIEMEAESKPELTHAQAQGQASGSASTSNENLAPARAAVLSDLISWTDDENQIGEDRPKSKIEKFPPKAIFLPTPASPNLVDHLQEIQKPPELVKESNEVKVQGQGQKPPLPDAPRPIQVQVENIPEQKKSSEIIPEDKTKKPEEVTSEIKKPIPVEPSSDEEVQVIAHVPAPAPVAIKKPPLPESARPIPAPRRINPNTSPYVNMPSVSPIPPERQHQTVKSRNSNGLEHNAAFAQALAHAHSRTNSSSGGSDIENGSCSFSHGEPTHSPPPPPKELLKEKTPPGEFSRL